MGFSDISIDIRYSETRQSCLILVVLKHKRAYVKFLHDVCVGFFCQVSLWWKDPSLASQSITLVERPLYWPLSLANINRPGMLHANGTMTKAVGTLRWMAPEVFRGDQTYTSAVDVYSFGIVMWELATREVPWASELPSGELNQFIHLNLALQTGRRPVIPTSVSVEHSSFVAVMKKCWAGDPADRPPFSEAVEDLASCLRDVAFLCAKCVQVVSTSVSSRALTGPVYDLRSIHLLQLLFLSWRVIFTQIQSALLIYENKF
jgi:serine/threonine protein kinase